MAKLTEQAVKDIRCSHTAFTQQSLADKYGVTQGAIWAVIHNKAWRHV
jgi:hypothetical protein